MELMMLFGDEVIDKIKVNSKKAKTPDYLACLQEELIERNEENLNVCRDEPHFVLYNIRPKANARSQRAYV